MRTLLSLATGALLIAAAGFGSSAHAQQAGPAVAPASAGPTLQAASIAVRSPAIEGALVPPIVQQGMRRSTRLMILGGAIFLAGALIGDDVGALIMIGGAATALYGLYIYLEQDAAAPPPRVHFE